jgi:hypothetical protein
MELERRVFKGKDRQERKDIKLALKEPVKAGQKALRSKNHDEMLSACNALEGAIRPYL